MGIEDELGWWSPDPRGVLLPAEFHASRSFERQRKAFEVSKDRAFRQVLEACADPGRPHGWIDNDFIDAYLELAKLGWAHSIEVWATDDAGQRVLAGGLFGVEVGGLFAAESMFHNVTGASKVAVATLCARLGADKESGQRIIDVQWLTPHLESLGGRSVGRNDYLALLANAIVLPNVL